MPQASGRRAEAAAETAVEQAAWTGVVEEAGPEETRGAGEEDAEEEVEAAKVEAARAGAEAAEGRAGEAREEGAVEGGATPMS